MGKNLNAIFGTLARSASQITGTPQAFIVAILSILVWASFGPHYDWSDTHQLIVNTGTTIISFLMIFLIQNTQNTSDAAIQAKLDELIRVGKAQNSYIGIEHLTQDEIEELRTKCRQRAELEEQRKSRERGERM
jgi:low affinity Fe/Cu permease